MVDSPGVHAVGRSIPTCVGTTRGVENAPAGAIGPSPRAWGLQGPSLYPPHDVRSIPTCVGTTRGGAGHQSFQSVHPHVRGDYGGGRGMGGFALGPSPRAWGLRSAIARAKVMVFGPSPRAWGLLQYQAAVVQERSIPTCVGTTTSPCRAASVMTVHPHVRGDYDLATGTPSAGDGPSPRAWGLLEVVNDLARLLRSIPTCVGTTARIILEKIAQDRSIPTCVGTTGWQRPCSRQSSVHPHVRGDYPHSHHYMAGGPGPSPRAWGLLGKEVRRELDQRSIPTCVGTTSLRW